MDSCAAHYPLDPECFDCCWETLTENPGGLADLTEEHPSGLARFTREHRAWVSELLISECARQPLIGWHLSGQAPLVVRWAAWAAPDMAQVLPAPAAVAVGLARARDQREGPHHLTSRVLEGLGDRVDQPLARLWCDLALLAGECDPVAAAGLRRRVEEQALPGRWARSLEWLMLLDAQLDGLGTQLDGLDVALTVALAEEHRAVRSAVAAFLKVSSPSGLTCALLSSGSGIH